MWRDWEKKRYEENGLKIKWKRKWIYVYNCYLQVNTPTLHLVGSGEIWPTNFILTRAAV